MCSASSSSPSPARTSRVRMGFAIGAVVVGLLMAGGVFWLLLVIAGCWLGFLELRKLMQAKGYRPSTLTVVLSGLGLFPLGILGASRYFSPMLTACVLLSFFRLLFRRPPASIADIGATLLSIVYVVYLPLHFLLLRELGPTIGLAPWQQPGFGFVFITLAVISASDITAYYGGRRFGKQLLYPAISPKKTREGALMGLAAGLLTGCLFPLWLGFPWVHGLLLSLLLTVVGQLGDLTESLLKRDAGIKDSGVIFQGHGGLLDRMDSYIFAGAVAYYYIYWVVLQQGLVKELKQLLLGVP